MLTLAILSGASFVLAGAWVGIRMLRLARRTRGLPELLLGSGLTGLTFVTLPAVFGSMLVKPGSALFQHALFVVGLAMVVSFAGSLWAFTTIVFHPRSRAAWALVVVAVLTAAVGVAGVVSTRIAAWGEDRVVSAHWAVMVMAVFIAGLAWTGVEAARYHGMMRRRLALGLVDPVVCNRFFLWAFGALGAVGGILVMAASVSLGLRIVSHPIPILAMSFAGFSLSASWLLAFVPPQGYLRWVRSRAVAAP